MNEMKSERTQARMSTWDNSERLVSVQSFWMATERVDGQRPG